MTLTRLDLMLTVFGGAYFTNGLISNEVFPLIFGILLIILGTLPGKRR